MLLKSFNHFAVCNNIRNGKRKPRKGIQNVLDNACWCVWRLECLCDYTISTSSTKYSFGSPIRSSFLHCDFGGFVHVQQQFVHLFHLLFRLVGEYVCSSV